MRQDVALCDLTETICRAAVDASHWSEAMTGIADALGARSMSLTIIPDAADERVPFVVAPRNDPEWISRYRERWAASNFVRERGLAWPLGATYRFEDLSARDAIDRTPFYSDWFAPQQQNVALFMNLAKGSSISGIGFYRSWREGQFSHAEERLVQLLGPHLRRAVALNLRFARMEMERDSAAQMLDRCEHGALLVDAEARVLYANRAAEALLRDGTALRLREGRLAASSPGKTAALRAMAAGAAVGAADGTLSLPRRDGGSVAAQILPITAETAWLGHRPGAILFLKDPSSERSLPSPAQIRALFDLTPAQAAVAREILVGDGIRAAADRLRISQATARTHLLEVFQKTGTSRQAELVRVILQSTFTAARSHPS